MNDFSKALNAGEEIDALFLDFAKTFDKVPHEWLCQKLLHYGVAEQIHLNGSKTFYMSDLK